jgi:broad specificity polyphosphatase/5'/3'-nucleotidase SurE
MIEKIDIINQTVYVYDDKFTLVKSLPLSDFTNINLPHYDNSKLYTINITQPIKRVINFQEINGLNTTAQFTEYPYSDMTDEEKSDLDLFIQEVENK